MKLLILIPLLALTACATTNVPCIEKQTQVDPLVIANCPPLAKLTDKSFGGTVNKLVEIATQYNKCRAAATAGEAK
jgi:hypothetical protein